MTRRHSYQHHGAGLIRASATTLPPMRWPALSDGDDCRAWLRQMWPLVSEAITHASPSLAARVDRILIDGRDRIDSREVPHVVLAVVRYVQRCSRSTPFGLFAGVAPATAGESTVVKFGGEHTPIARIDSGWLREVVARLEFDPGLLALLDVVFNDSVEESSGRITLTRAEPVSIRDSGVVRTIRGLARTPIRLGDLRDRVIERFPRAGDPSPMLRELVSSGFLITCLHAPSTVVSPLTWVLDRLRALDLEPACASAALVSDLEKVDELLQAYNRRPRRDVRRDLIELMRGVADTARGPLSVDLRLDASVQLGSGVTEEILRTADVITRLVREPTGTRAWRDFYTAFCERYGVGAMVPLRHVIDPDAGIGWPRGYPTTPEASTDHVFSRRDQVLLEMVSEAAATGAREVVLNDQTVHRLIEAEAPPDAIPPHFDFGARIHAISPEAIDAGDYTFTVMPGRSAGILSSRFSDLVPDLAAVYGQVPTTVADALPMHLSATPMYENAENLGRARPYLPVLAVGEYPAGTEEATDDPAVSVDDLLVTASWRRLHLVSRSLGRVVEPMVFHALIPKQQPALARFIGEISRALDTGWPGFDWGAAAVAPFRPRLRYRRAILSPAKWVLQRHDLLSEASQWEAALDEWRAKWRCPARVELQDLDQLLPLDLTVPAHVQVLLKHLRASDVAVLSEAPDADADNWCEGRNHTVVLPLTRTAPPEPGPRVETLPVLAPGDGHAPGSDHARWLYIKLFLPAHRMDALVNDQVPRLIDMLDDRPWWFVRYPKSNFSGESDQLRLRISVNRAPSYSADRSISDMDETMATVAAWADGLRAEGRIGRYMFDTYYPETGRYLAIDAAENLFAADSRFAVALHALIASRQLSAGAATALSMFDMVSAVLGDRDGAAAWYSRDIPTTKTVGRDLLGEVQALARNDLWQALPDWPAVAAAHARWRDAAALYRQALPAGADIDEVLRSMLHMLHNRALGADRESEAQCLHLARAAAATWTAFHGSHVRIGEDR